MQKELLVRIGVTVLLGVLLLAVFVPPLQRAIFAAPPFTAADTAGRSYVDAAFNRALVAFALARTANAVISVIQGSELDVAPAGIGMTIAVGEALDPLNDMIERFSWVMLLSLVSLGIQKLLLDIVPWLSLTLVLAPALVLLLLGTWWPAVANRYRLPVLGRRLLLLALLLRFCIPLTAWINDALYARFLAGHYDQAIGEFEQGNKLLESLDPLPEGRVASGKTGIFDQVKEQAQRLQAVTDLRRQFDALKLRFSEMIEQLLTMIAVFLLNSVLLPLAFLWFLSRLSRRLFAGLTSFFPPGGADQNGQAISPRLR